MKYTLLIALLAVAITSQAQNKQNTEADKPFWTIWFRLSKPSKEFEAKYDSTKCRACDSLKYHPHDQWVQSYSDSATAYAYYRRLKYTGTVVMWNRYLCQVDTSFVYIDKYSMTERKYLQIKQP